MKQQTNIKCTHCDYEWKTRSKKKYVTCSSCTRKTLNPVWIRENDIKLYRIWSYDSNDRSEIARAISPNFDTVQEHLLKTFIKPEYKDQIEKTEVGLEWNAQTPQECFENLSADDKQDQDPETICEMCDGCTTGFQIEEIERPSGQYWGETFEFKTIFGTNDFYDLTTKRAHKSKDWNPLVASVAKAGDMRALGSILTHDAKAIQREIRKEQQQ